MPALDFPASPTDGQVYGNWIWNAAKGAWKAKPLTAMKATPSDTAPASPQNGDEWLNTVDGCLYVYYTDVDGSQWVQVKNDASFSSTLGPRVDALEADGNTNFIINGAFDIWQRGTSFSLSSYGYTADRWLVDHGTITRQLSGIPQATYCLQIANATGNPAVRQGVELPATGVAGDFVTGSTWTVSFYAKVSTTITSNMALYIAFADGTAGGNAVQVVSVSTLPVPGTSWSRYSYTFTIGVSPAGTNKCLAIVPYLNSGSYAGNFSITGVQLQAGALATAFHRNAPSLQAELAACQRYYWRLTGVTTGYYEISTSATSRGGTSVDLNIMNPVTMRVAPTSYDFGGAMYCEPYYGSGASKQVSSMTLDTRTSPQFTGLILTMNSTGFAAGSREMTYFGNGTGNYLGMSAEL